MKTTRDTARYTCRELSSADGALLKELLAVFGQAFGEIDTYQGAIPSDRYLTELLARPHFIAIVALHDGEVVGGLAAYVLDKFERERREIYIYDLAVLKHHRRKGIATELIRELQHIAKTRSACVIYVQADLGDEAAIALYSSLGVKETVHHFDIAVGDEPRSRTTE